MSETSPVVLTISRQLGSGAAFIGQQLAARLNMVYLDREILQQAARQLQISEDLLREREEAVTSFWQSLLQPIGYGGPEAMYMPPPLILPTDHELFELEARIITQVVRTQSAVVVGRGGVHVLRGHPRHLSIFIHADTEFRLQRIEALYHLSEKEARAAIDASDSARARYHRKVAGKEWTDARQYHLCLDTGVLGIDGAIEMILACVNGRFGMVCA